MDYKETLIDLNNVNRVYNSDGALRVIYLNLQEKDDDGTCSQMTSHRKSGSDVRYDYENRGSRYMEYARSKMNVKMYEHML